MHHTWKLLLFALLIPIIGPIIGLTTGFPGMLSAQTKRRPAAKPVPEVRYLLSFPNAVHHEIEVTATWSGLTGKSANIRLSRSSPGRYALHEFAKNVYNARASDIAGNPLPVQQPDPYSWNVPVQNGGITFSYTVYGDHADGTYAGVDAVHAHLNGPAVFAWIKGTENSPITVTFKLSPAWPLSHTIATQLYETADAMTYTAPSLYYLMDSPIEIGPITYRTWTMHSADTVLTLRMALHHTGTDSEATAYAQMVKNVVAEEEGVFGELPKFETGRYTFLIDYFPYVFGDGMEHRNSTSITGTRQISTNAVDNIGTVSHEFFHAWNVKRIRPAALEPFDFMKVNMSGELWLAEGFTNYYGKIALERAGLNSVDRFLKSSAGALSNVLNSPSHAYFNVVDMSNQAGFADGGQSNDEVNRTNTFISYYTYGEAIAFGLDLSLREHYPGVTLDSLMRVMWQTHGKVMHPYNVADIEKALARTTGDKPFAHDFFARYVFGKEVLPYNSILAKAGLVLRRAHSGKATAGPVFLRTEDGKGVITGATVIGTPFYNLGLDRRDKIKKIDSVMIAGQKDLDSVLILHKPGDETIIEYEQRGVAKTGTIRFAEAPEYEVVMAESASVAPTEAAKTIRTAWLASAAKTDLVQIWKYCPMCHKKYPFIEETCPDDKAGLKILP